MKNILLCLGGLLMTLDLGFSADSSKVLAAGGSDLSMESAFQKGKWELGINGGVMFSPVVFINAQKHTINYTTSGIQIGYMLNDPNNAGWWRGNLELVNEVVGGVVIEGRGSYVIGDTLWLRYNFVPVGRKLKPYAQFGGGAESTDIDRRILGQDFNFNVGFSVGLRYMVTHRCSVNLEYRFQHLSDAFMTKVNRGTNAQGAVLGISWLF
jgi:opacity protein-like surface antigen